MERGELTALYVHRREPGAVRGRRAPRASSCCAGSTTWSCRTSSCTATAELADVVLPAAAGWCEAEGTVTNSERRVQRVRKALDPPGEARDDMWILGELARRLGHDWGDPTAEEVWDELRSLSPMHARHELRAAGGARRHPVAVLGRGAPRRAVPARPAVGASRVEGPPRAVHRRRARSRRSTSSSTEFPLRLTTGRRLDSYNTGVQTGGYTSPLRRGEALDLSPEDAAALGSTTASACASSRAAARSRRRCASTARCARASRS